MAGLIKKQILKHLSRFAKNLSPDKINLSTLKGEGQLTNLELDEEVLQNMLDLPTWLAINKVFCNKAAIRIPWTKLKTHPITLSLDKVIMEMSTCDEPRPPNGPSPIATASGQSEYGFAEKVVEGISLSVNSIVIRISAKAFNASFELSQLQVYSVNTSWATGDLRYTRILDPTRGEILTFKEVSWQMIRIEADAIQNTEHEVVSAPIRLITNQSKIRVSLKRRIKDCNVIASKLILILDDLLWVLTDSQLKAMVQYATSLSEAMEKSAAQRKSMAPDTTQVTPAPPSAQQVRTQQASATADQSASMARLFNAYDVRETSHHLQITHLDLHICDDTNAKDRGINKRFDGGAMQLSFNSISVDYYPYHKAGETCMHWMHYGEATKSRETWARSLLDEFKSNLEMLKNAVSGQTQSSPQHGKISTSSSTSFSPPPPPRTQLMSSSIVLRMADFSIYQVSTADQSRSSPQSMISCNKKSLYLPQEMPAIHAEFTEYYFPDGKDYPIPCPNLYVQLNALQLVLDSRSLVWLNLFALDLRQSLEQFMELYKLNDSQKPDEHVDIRVDGLMLKLVIPADQKKTQPDQPRSVSVQTSEMVATNTRHSSGCTRSSLEALLQAFQEQPFFTSLSLSFPRSQNSFSVLHSVFQRHAHEQDTRIHDVYRGLAPPSLSTNALKTPAATDLWAVHFSQFWVDYEGSRSGRGRPTPCVDSFPLTLWVCHPARYTQHHERLRAGVGSGLLPRRESAEIASRLQRKKLLKEYYSTDASPSITPSNGLHKPHSLDGLFSDSSSSLSLASSSLSSEVDLHMIVHVQKHLSAQVSHGQYVFLLRLQNAVKSLQRTLQQDLEQYGSKRQGPTQPFSACVGVLMKSAEVALLLKPIPQPDLNTSPLDSDVSPSESRATLEAGSEVSEGHERPSAAGEGTQNADQLLCAGTHAINASPLLPSPSPALRKASVDERSSVVSGGRVPSEEKKDLREGSPNGEGNRTEAKGQQSETSQGGTMVVDPMSDNSSREWNDQSQGGRLPQSMSRKGSLSVVSDLLTSTHSRSTSLYSMSNIGRLIQGKSQSSFSVSFSKIMKKSPSLQSLDDLSIDSYSLEDCDSYSLLERDDVSISGFKEVLNEQFSTEGTNVTLAQEADEAQSPDAISAASQSIDEPTKDLVSVLVLKIHSVCCSLDLKGDDTAVALEVGRIRPNQLGNVSLRQYLSNRSLGSGSGSDPSTVLLNPEVQVRLESGPGAAVHSPLAEQNGFLQCRLQAFSADFLMTSLRNLSLFLEDDSASQVLPMEITIKDTHVNLKDDGPRDNASEPEATPIAVHIHNLLIHRQDDGSFSIGGAEHSADSKLQKAGPVNDSRLSSVPEVPVGVASEPKATQTAPLSPTSPTPPSREQLLMEENECLKLELSKAKMALAEAQMEKDSLQHQMKTLKLTSGGNNS
ncbi:bridge-like lipid transfer protein family member 3B isoform X1 [Sinocyclocheilus anshuiensis]|uniref:bridge-like lipid transfer protein family member 3B isoform X1 n=1 Tax=Sinocyclocheilus anshuiensis TaxID=1608454 RepID=UPI0007B81A00|nr:PREDICTED: UHRF1-binding protein 1-like isoform X1 [Sinocyclocheilus anshuiensis]